MDYAELDDLVNTADAALRAGVEQATIRAWRARGKLKVAGLDAQGRPMHRLIDVYKAERAARQYSHRGRRPASLAS